MRTTLNLDDDLITEAGRLTQIAERTALVRAALQALIERESAKRLAKLQGSQNDAEAPQRRRSA